MNHVNCIIIDKHRKFILYFEPTVLIRYDLDQIKFTLCSANAILYNFAFLIPEDIGYSVFNCLQKFDNYCQTYVLYVYCLLLENREIDPDNFRKLFNGIITSTNRDYFIYFINRLLQDKGINLDNLGDYHNIDANIDDINIDELDEDWMVVHNN